MHTDVLTELEQESRKLIDWLDAQPRSRRLFEGTLDAQEYAAFLVQTYHYVRWTTPLLALAGTRMRRDGLHPALAGLLLQKSAEEQGHEQWVLADLRALGWDAEVVRRVEPVPAVAAYVAWNRFTADAGSPTAFLGTAYVLESLSVLRAGVAARRLVERGAIPNVHRAVTFLRGHAGADGEHVAELATVLRGLTAPEEQEALVLSARATRALYQGLFSGGPLSLSPSSESSDSSGASDGGSTRVSVGCDAR
ncbi:MAG TPA: iron-containing redox enzyme family protein [Myxococcus sp.]|nr:iron-containing redox enzyme family protein [Myxococcus sp.]